MLLLAVAFIPTGIKWEKLSSGLSPLSDVDGLSEFGRDVTKSDLHHFPGMEPLSVGSGSTRRFKFQLPACYQCFCSNWAAKLVVLPILSFRGRVRIPKFRDIFGKNPCMVSVPSKPWECQLVLSIQAEGLFGYTPEIQAFTLNGDEVLIILRRRTFQTHRSYQYRD